MRKYLLFLGAIMLSLPVFATKANAPIGDDDPVATITACLPTAAGGNATGFYSFSTATYGTLKKVAGMTQVASANAGVCYGTNYYVTNYEEFLGSGYPFFRTIDITSWTVTASKSSTHGLSLTSIATDLTYDISTRKVYGCFYKTVGNKNAFVLGIEDLNTGLPTAVADLAQRLVALEAANDGTLYAVGVDGKFYTVDKTSGTLSLVGNTGLTPHATTCQSMAFDHKNGVLYWAMTPASGKSGLYTINLTTGVATKVYDFSNNEAYVGLHIDDPKADADPAEPQAVGSFNISLATPGSRNVTLSYINPVADINGNDLDGLTKVEIKRDGTVIHTDNNPVKGDSKFYTDENAPRGNHTYTVTATNTHGSSTTEPKTIFVGYSLNLSITESSFPTYIKEGTKGIISVSYTNDSYSSCTKFNVNLFKNAVLIESREQAAMASDESAEMEFEIEPDGLYTGAIYYVVLDVSDEFELDNETEFTTVYYVYPVLVVPTELDAEGADNKVNLSWTEPEYNKEETESSIALELLGYNVYRDGNLVNESLVTEPSYSDIPGDTDEHEYCVTAVYDRGESFKTDPVTGAAVSAVNAITASGTDACDVYTIDGRLVARGISRSAIPAGIYMVRETNNTVSKIIKK